MISNEFQILVYAIIFSYVCFIPVFYFILNEKAKIINIIALSRNNRKRSEFNDIRDNAEKDTPLALVWPYLILKSAAHALKRKQ